MGIQKMEKEFQPNEAILAVDVGAGTQDILVYRPGRPIENSEKLIVPSQTQVVARQIESVTALGFPLHLGGHLMGGGASSESIERHLAAGFPVTANSDAARTIHNRPERVASLGVTISEDPPAEALVVEFGDIDRRQIEDALELFGVPMPPTIAVAVQDHGYRPGAGNNDVRFQFLQSLIDDGGSFTRMVFSQPPANMTRMESIARTIPGVYLMDTGAAAVLGVRGDPIAREHIDSSGAVVVNVGNMHTFAALVKGDRLYGLFEHHSHGMTADLLDRLVSSLRQGTLDPASFHKMFDGHGAAYTDDYIREGPFEYVVITGPNRGIAHGLSYHEAAPFGDMMLTGCFGLIEGVRRHQQTDINGSVEKRPQPHV
jgi:uncharacterized protein (DUF1786 family)